MPTPLLPRVAAAALTLVLLPTSASADSLAPPSHVRTYASHGDLAGALSDPRGVTAVGSSTAVADAGNHRISIFDRHGRHVRDLTGFHTPNDVAATPGGDLAVADTKNNRVQVVSPTGTTRVTFGSPGLDDGEFLLPMAVAVADDGSIVVSDHANHRIQIFDRHGHWRRTIGGVEWPRGVAVDGDRLIVATGERIAVFDLQGDPILSRHLGWEPWDVAVDGRGRIYVSGSTDRSVAVLDVGGRPLTRFGRAGSAPGRFGGAPRGLTVASNGSVHTVDASGRVHVWRFHTCAGQPATHVGTAGDDSIIGTNRRDVIVTFGGNDEVRARGGHDLICLGSGDDIARGGNGRDLIRGGGGHDRLRGGDGIDEIAGGRGNDRLRGGDRDDSLHGGAGRDVLDGGRGSDACTGGSGVDVIRRCEGKASSRA